MLAAKFWLQKKKSQTKVENVKKIVQVLAQLCEPRQESQNVSHFNFSDFAQLL